MSERELYCDSCQGVQLFEVPPCGDGHAADCPELACTGCGAAMVLATVRLAPARRGLHRAPPPGRRPRAA